MVVLLQQLLLTVFGMGVYGSAYVLLECLDSFTVLWGDEWEWGEMGEEGSLDEYVFVAEGNHLLFILFILLLREWYENGCWRSESDNFW